MHNTNPSAPADSQTTDGGRCPEPRGPPAGYSACTRRSGADRCPEQRGPPAPPLTVHTLPAARRANRTAEKPAVAVVEPTAHPERHAASESAPAPPQRPASPLPEATHLPTLPGATRFVLSSVFVYVRPEGAIVCRSCQDGKAGRGNHAPKSSHPHHRNLSARWKSPASFSWKPSAQSAHDLHLPHPNNNKQ